MLIASSLFPVNGFWGKRKKEKCGFNLWRTCCWKTHFTYDEFYVMQSLFAAIIQKPVVCVCVLWAIVTSYLCLQNKKIHVKVSLGTIFKILQNANPLHITTFFAATETLTTCKNSLTVNTTQTPAVEMPSRKAVARSSCLTFSLILPALVRFLCQITKLL